MARFLINTGPYPGHIVPSTPIVRKLIERDHEVVWITGRQYKEKVEATGARFHPLPKESDPNEMETYDFYPELKKLKGLAQIKYWIKHIMLDSCSRDIEAFDTVLTDFHADVLVGDTIAVALSFKSEIGRLPCATISLLPLSLPSRDTAPFGLGLLPGKNLITKTRNQLLNFLTYHVLLHDVTTYTNNVRRELGLEPLDGPFFQSMWKISSLIMQISTPAFEYHRSDQPENLNFIGPVLPEPDDIFQSPYWWSDLNCSKSVILVNQGTLAKNLDDLIVPTIKGLKNEQMLVVSVPVEEG
jgi:UDP:flavonoid glycosyltransferase YjiC (YdhE family)